jgi:hypothetical protein
MSIDHCGQSCGTFVLRILGLRNARLAPPAAWMAILCGLFALSALVNVPLAQAEGGSLSAAQIAERAVRADTSNWSGAKTRVRMSITEADGKVKERSLDVTGRKKDGLYQSLVRFLAPADVAGTAFLMLERGKDESEQYIYLPAMKRTRRIAGRERDGNFMGSDFTYADMQGVDLKASNHTRQADEKLGADNCYVIESVMGAQAKLAYGKVVTWVRQSDFIALRTKFYDRSGKLIKTLYTRRVKNVDGTPVVVEARMQSDLTSHVTDIFVDSIERKDDLPDAQFTPGALEHL